jgi:hypothetical protein
MHSVHNLTHSEILQKAKQTALEERRLGIALLHYLQEIERRRIFSPQFSSLHEYVVRELGYSDGAAHRRISAMRLMRDVADVEKKLSSGSLTLSTASQVQNFLVVEKRSGGNLYSTDEKENLIRSVENKSTRQTEALLAARSPRTMAVIRERPRSIDGENVQVTLTLTASLQSKLEKLKNLMAHRHPNPSISEQLEMLADLALQRLDPSTRPIEPRKISTSERSAPGRRSGAEAHSLAPKARTRFIPISARRAIWNRAGHRCEYRASDSRIRCSRRHLLQVDHRLAFSRGGGNGLENLQLLCATHNQWKGTRSVKTLTAASSNDAGSDHSVSS